MGARRSDNFGALGAGTAPAMGGMNHGAVHNASPRDATRLDQERTQSPACYC